MAAGSLVLKIHRRDYRLVHHLHHVDKREYDEYHHESVLDEQKQNGTYEEQGGGSHGNIAVRELSLLVDQACDERLEYD